ncbi:MAG: hypothetical protein PQJ58_07195 [Spirochaetales bacterium]|nr:hypothetical protein [Spirochaetales bacterium]
MKRKTLISLFLLLITAAGIHAESRFHIHSVSLMGVEPVGRYKMDVTKTGFSAAQELYFSTGGLLQFGGGFRYLFPRETRDSEQLTFIPVYTAVKLFLPVETVPLYAKGAVGYNFIEGNSQAVNNLGELKGGLYYSLGGGVDFPVYYTDSVRFSFIFDMGWSSYSGTARKESSESKLSYTTMDILAGLGIRF